MKDRKVIITGASGGLGQAVVKHWLDLGAQVIAVASTEQSLDKLPDQARLNKIAANLTEPSEIAQMLEKANKPDTLIHLVGGFAMGPIDGSEAQSNYQKMVAANLTSTYLCFSAMTPILKAQGRGWMLATGSKAATTHPGGLSAYVATKAAVHALVKSLGEELKSSGIHVNAIVPSTIDTPANRAAMGDKNANKWVSPQEIAQATEFLCSEASSATYGTLLELYAQS
ncbi:3-oxoacyl-ACP reductase FabG [soil metagenome]